MKQPISETHSREEELVTKEELSGFYGFSVGCEGYAGVAIAVFYPFILKALAAANAFERDDHSIKCKAVGEYTCDIPIFGGYVDTSSIVLFATSLSVLMQFFLFITLGSLADYGSKRKQFMLFFGYLTAILGVGMAFVIKDSLYWLAYLIYVTSNVAFGASWVFNYAWVPVLTRYSKDVSEARLNPLVNELEYHKISDHRSNVISHKGFFYGYVSATIQLIIGAAFAVFVPAAQIGLSSTYNIQIVVVGTSVFQILVLYFYVQGKVKPRPGPPLPNGAGYISYSLKEFWATLKQARQLSQLFKFLLGWFVYSDSFSTVVSAALLFAQGELGASEQILYMSAIIVPLAAAFGNKLWHLLQVKTGMKTKRLIMLQSLAYSLLPFYGVVGFLFPKGTMFGLNNQYELPFVAIYHGRPLFIRYPSRSDPELMQSVVQ